MLVRFYRHKLGYQTRCVLDRNVPCDSFSVDDGEDNVATHKAALAKERESQEMKQQVLSWKKKSEAGAVMKIKQ